MTATIIKLNTERSLEQAKDEVLRKIGRNIYNFQVVEHMLKFLIRSGKVEGTLGNIAKKQQAHVNAVNSQTLGPLVAQLLDSMMPEHDETKYPEEIKEIYMKTTFGMEVDSAFYESKKQELSALVAERNNLVHHLIPRFNPSSIQSCIETEQYLDVQNEKLMPELNYLKSLSEQRQEMIKKYSELVNSEQFNNQLELICLQKSNIVILLEELIFEHSRPDGWTSLATVGSLINERLPGKLVAMKKQHKYKTLKQLILASELFNIMEENTPKGGLSIFYQLKIQTDEH